MTPLRLNASGHDRVGRASASTCDGPSCHAQTSSRFCGSSSHRPWPTASWPTTKDGAWTTPSACGGEPSTELVSGVSLSEASRRVTRMAAKATTRSPGHRCSECGWSAVKWVGRCGECQAWGTVSEIGAVKVTTTAAVVVNRPAMRIGEADAHQAEARTTGVIQFEGDRHSRLRLVRAVKNRYGPTDEVGCFDLSDIGIVGLPDPSGLFLSSRDLIVPGTCVTVALEGRRPLVAEVQALLSATTAPSPRRTTSGLDSSRVAMILAVLDKRANAPVRQADCYVSTVGGVRVSEPASDLAIALAIASSVSDRALPPGTVAMGEVGLAGEIRAVTGIPRRLAEAARLGLRKTVVPTGALGTDPTPAGMEVIEVCDIRDAVRLGISVLAGT